MVSRILWFNVNFKIMFDFVHCFRRLSIYPLGDKKTRRDAEYMSLYLVLDEQISAPVDVVIKFFAYDHIRERYLMVEGTNLITLHMNT